MLREMAVPGLTEATELTGRERGKGQNTTVHFTQLQSRAWWTQAWIPSTREAQQEDASKSEARLCYIESSGPTRLHSKTLSQKAKEEMK